MPIGNKADKKKDSFGNKTDKANAADTGTKAAIAGYSKTWVTINVVGEIMRKRAHP